MHQVKQFLKRQRMENFVRRVDLTGDEIELRLRSTFIEKYNGAIIDNYVFDVYLLNTDTVIGFCDLRIGDRKALLYLGNVGYSVLFKYRGHSFASKSVEILLRLARELKETTIYITCNPDNVASVRTIEKLNATFLNRVDVPPSEPLYHQGDIEKNIYKIDLQEDASEYH